jgi:hypothetical protein
MSDLERRTGSASWPKAGPGAGPNRERGIALMELLVGMVTALLVTAAAFATVRVLHESSTEIDDLARLTRQGGFAMQRVGGFLREAGSVDPERDPVSGLHAFPVDRLGAGDAAPLAGTDGKDGASDSVSVLFVAPQAPHPSAADAGRPAPKPTPYYDCSGAAIDAGTPVRMRFEVDPAGRLMCSARQRQPVIDDVAGLRLRYRVEVGAGLQTLDARAVDRARRWAEVRAVEVCMDLVNGRSAPRPARAYLGCDGATADPQGRRHLVMRQLFSLRRTGGST